MESVLVWNGTVDGKSRPPEGVAFIKMFSVVKMVSDIDDSFMCYIFPYLHLFCNLITTCYYIFSFIAELTVLI